MENFPKGKRYGFFPSASIGWVPSSEDFWNSDVFSHLKVRGSYGQVGNDQIGGRRFLYLTNVNSSAWAYFWGSSHFDPGGGVEESQMGVQNVTWEVSTKANVGLDIGLLGDVFNLQIDAFHEIRDNILIERQTVPDYVGIISVPAGNLGKVRNLGVDGMLEIKKSLSNGFFYSVRGNFSYAHNKILENDEPDRKYKHLERKGHRIDQYFGYVALGFFQDEADIANSPVQEVGGAPRVGDIKYKDISGDGIINSDDITAIGYAPVPEIMFGIGGTVAYKNFDVTLYFSGVANRSTFLDGDGMYPFSLEYPNYNVFREYYDNRWIPGAADNSSAKYPAVVAGNNTNNYQTSTMYMLNAAYIKLNNAEIGYTIPSSVTDKIKMNKIRVFANGSNLYTWDYVKVVDPEMTQTGGYPMQRAINFGAQFDF